MFLKLDRLLAKEIITLTLVITAGVSSVFIMAKIPRYAEFLFSAPDTTITFIMLVLYILPAIIKLVVPISLLLATALVLVRMSTDRELEGWMGGGTSLLRLAWMPSLLGIAVTLISLCSSLWFEPYSNRQFEQFKWMQTRNVVESLLKSTLKEKTFLYEFPVQDNIKLSLYFNKFANNGSSFSDVFLAAQQLPEKFSSVIVAQEGGLEKTSNNGLPDYTFLLKSGTAYDSSNDNWNSTTFADSAVSLVNMFKNKFKIDSTLSAGTDQLYPLAYVQFLKTQMASNPNWATDKKILYQYLFFLKQLLIPCFTIFLPIIGVCLGLQDPRSKQVQLYVGIGLVILALYASLLAAQQLVLNFKIPIYSFLLITPIVLSIITLLLLFWRLRYPPATGFFEFIKHDFYKLKKKNF